MHFGMTSSDLLDTALALQLTESTDLLLDKCAELLAACREHALAHRATLRVGRTHGIHAEPDVWGHRVADFAFAIARCRDRLIRARESVAVGKLSGRGRHLLQHRPGDRGRGDGRARAAARRRGDPGRAPGRHRRVDRACWR